MNIYEPLRTYFGYEEFKEGQEKLIRASVQGRDALGIMPTGGGKSLCYQLPAVLSENITLVISPLIALMKDQVDSLKEMGIAASFINSTLDGRELNERLDEIRSGKYKLLYVAPERLNSYLFRELLKDIKVSMVAIDEAHCISQWGHDFRPSYLEIPKFINSFETRPGVSAYTATATESVIEEIKDLIGLRNPVESIIGFDRPNLFYKVVKASNGYNYLKNYLENNFQNEAGIIYSATRKTVESLTKRLKEEGIEAVGYHGGMSPEIRQRHQEDFIFNRARIIVATNAFGMGIDKPDVRFVIHYNMPKNMEAYYQEAGRAGRDGEPSDCILLYSPGDIVKQKLLIQNNPLSLEREENLYKNLQYLIDYCNTNNCLRNNILNYFGESPEEDTCNNCGNCLDDSEMVDITIEAQKILSCIYRVGERYGMNLVVLVLRGSRSKRVLDFGLDKLSTYGIMKEYSEDVLKEIVMTLVSMGYIEMTADKYPVLRLTAKSNPILKGEEEVYHKKDLLEAKEAPRRKIRKSIGDNFHEGLFEELRDLRYKTSQKKKIAPYMIFHNSALEEMSAYLPRTEEEFLKIKGVGVKKYESYGEDFIKLIQAYSKENDLKPVEAKKEIVIAEEPSLEDRYEETYNSYLKGLCLKEIAKERGYTVNTIINHLDKSSEEGREVNWSKFLDEPEKEEKIMEAIGQVGVEKLSAIKAELSKAISYEEIRLTIVKNKKVIKNSWP